MATRKKDTTAEEISAEEIPGQEEIAVAEPVKRGRKASTLGPVAARFERLSNLVEAQKLRTEKANTKAQAEQEKLTALGIEFEEARTALAKALDF